MDGAWVWVYPPNQKFQYVHMYKNSTYVHAYKSRHAFMRLCVYEGGLFSLTGCRSVGSRTLFLPYIYTCIQFWTHTHTHTHTHANICNKHITLQMDGAWVYPKSAVLPQVGRIRVWHTAVGDVVMRRLPLHAATWRWARSPQVCMCVCVCVYTFGILL
jgi:hypothetical protein